MVLLKILAIAVCAIVAYQDIKDRMVIWVAFPMMAVLLTLIHATSSGWEAVFWFSVINLLLVSGVLLLLFIYTRLASRQKFLNTSLGLGDILFFYAFSFGFPTLTFVILFVASLFFSLFLFLALKSIRQMETVPLAGYISLFLIGAIAVSFFTKTPNLYQL
ncbi:general secretion pathway protein [Ulvibacterium sp.]|uniref:general secretion pathway protein n=1 Tax=Ulvibacterium sp. TaxID=2665914 RepID=UPI0026346ACD|nr:general secretion pathway protein [Ulvibacterium sp.]